MKIVFFGTPAFAAKILEDLVHAGIEIVAVVTRPDKPQGRSSKLIATHVKAKAQSLIPQVPVYQPEKCSTTEFVSILKAFHADLYVVVAYGEIMKQEVLDVPPLGCVNVHASLLPAYRGAAPMQRCLMNGEKETGISIIKLVRKMDAGDVIRMQKIDIPEEMTCPELEKELCDLGSTVLLQAIEDIDNGRATYTPQDHVHATFADKILPEECQINWNKPAQDIHNLVRAVTPHPGAFFFASIRGERKRVKIVRSRVDKTTRNVVAEIVSNQKNKFSIGCGANSLEVLELQVEGKPVMKIEDFLRGCPVSGFSVLS